MATAQDIIDRARLLLVDSPAVRWADAELLNWISDGQNQIVLLVPSANAKHVEFTCAAGTLQTLSTNGVQLLDVIRNADGGMTPISLVARTVLDSHDPAWHLGTSATTVEHYVYDERTPTQFMVYPGVVAGAKLDIVQAQLPAAVTAVDDALDLTDIYIGALVDYVCYRAFTKDADYAQNTPRADRHYNQFLSALSGKRTVQLAEGPGTSFNHPQPGRNT